MTLRELKELKVGDYIKVTDGCVDLRTYNVKYLIAQVSYIAADRLDWVYTHPYGNIRTVTQCTYHIPRKVKLQVITRREGELLRGLQLL